MSNGLGPDKDPSGSKLFESVIFIRQTSPLAGTGNIENKWI